MAHNCVTVLAVLLGFSAMIYTSHKMTDDDEELHKYVIFNGNMKNNNCIIIVIKFGTANIYNLKIQSTLTKIQRISITYWATNFYS